MRALTEPNSTRPAQQLVGTLGAVRLAPPTLAAAVVLFALFVVLERRHPRPLLRLRLLRSASLVHANLVGALLLGSYVAFQFILTPYVQNSLGWSPIQMALSSLHRV